MISRRPWAILALVLATAAFGTLGAWQVSRGQARQHYLDQLATQPPAEEHGEYLAGRQLLLDGQAHEGVPGYHVWTPLKVAGGSVLIVDRGWVPASAVPDLAAPAGELAVRGLWRPLPAPAIRLQGPAPACPAASYPKVVEYPEAGELACVLGVAVRNGVLLLDPSADGGFVREWTPPGFPPARHYAYAAQWFGLCLVSVVVLYRLFRSAPK